LNIGLEINNERQDCKIGTVWGVLLEGRRVNGDDGNGIWLMDFIHTYKIE
jgi:hypothetical protein